MSAKSNFKNSSVISSFKNAFTGFRYILKTQRNARIHLLGTTLVFISSLLLGLQPIEFGILCLACGLVFSLEAMNTAVESTVDLVTEDYHELAKIAKDVAASSVLVASIFAAITWLFVCAPVIVVMIKV